MFPHHEAAVANVVARFSADDEVLAIVLAGSIAHGYATASSDVDILLVVSDLRLAELESQSATAFSDVELAGYEGGYIDVKYVSPGYIDLVAERGSEPARFAFEGARVVFSRVEGIEARLHAASRYPLEVKLDRVARFAAQLDAWRWMAGEAGKKNDPYLAAAATSRVVLFAGRLLLAHNERLYPFHKWFLRELDAAPLKPEGIVELMRTASASPSAAGAEAVADAVFGFREWERGDVSWPNHFIHDTEQAWVRDAASVGDL